MFKFMNNDDLFEKIEDCFIAAAAAALIVGLPMLSAVRSAEADAWQARHYAERVSQEALEWSTQERPWLLFEQAVRRINREVKAAMK